MILDVSAYLVEVILVRYVMRHSHGFISCILFDRSSPIPFGKIYDIFKCEIRRGYDQMLFVCSANLSLFSLDYFTQYWSPESPEPV